MRGFILRHAVSISITLSIVLVGMLAAMLVHPQGAQSAATGCDVVIADLPVLTDNIQTEWVVSNCDGKYQVRSVLLEESGGSWSRAACSGNSTGQCVHIHPLDAENASCDPFYCSGSDHNVTDTWNQDDSACNQNYRTRVTVLNVNGDVIGTDTSPTNSC